MVKTNKINWTEKYRPRTLSQVVGHPTAIEQLEKWAEEWKYGTPKVKAIALHGKPGTGKTTACYALANDMKWEVVELNASDQRTAKIIEKIAGSASKMGSLSGSKKLIVIDEADNIYGTSDRGGEKAVIELIKETRQPIILTANNFYDISIGLRNSTKPIQFKSISTNTIMSILRQIADAENIIYAPGVFEKMADKAEGDLRGAINDLEAISLGKTKLEIKDITTGDRDVQENIFKVLAKLFKGKDIKDAYYSTFTIDQNPEDLIHWIDENLPLEYTKPEDLERGYDYLSKASVFLGRVKRRQNYGMWKYASLLMTSGMVVAKSVENKIYVKYQSPTFWRELGQKKRFRSIRDSTAKKIGEKCHVSINNAKLELLPFFRVLIKDERYALSIAASLDLNTDEIEFITGYDSNAVQKIYNAAQAAIKKEKDTDVELFGRFGESFVKEQQRQEEEDLRKQEEVRQEEVRQKKEQQKEEKTDKSQKSLFDF